MRTTTYEEAAEWVTARGIGAPFNRGKAERFYAHRVSYALPTDVGRRTALGRALATFVEDTTAGLLWITEWGVFPSAENMPLFDGYRRSLGETRPLHEAPAHLFDRNDRQEVVCLLDLALYFFWDASIFDDDRLCIRLSHDEYVTVYARDEPSLAACRELFEHYRLQKL